ncbi:MAG: bifunctional nuclease domain-containing protein [Bacteroidota bacterium]
MKKHLLEIYGLIDSRTASGGFVLTLKEVNGVRRLPIVIGRIEAESIAVELEKLTPVRPLTHDLFRTFANAFDITLDEVIIYNFKEGIFFSMLCFTSKKDGSQHQIDSRTSDAIGLALRFDAPIYTYDKILNTAGVNLEEFDNADNQDGFGFSSKADNHPVSLSNPPSSSGASMFEGMDNEELENALNNALEDEDYETASKIRDEMNKRGNNQTSK